MCSKSYKIIDLSTDITTLPSKEMVEFMSTATVGDDCCDGDPSINALKSYVCTMFNVEDAIFLPTATMGNLISFLVVCNPGDIVYSDKTYHAIHLEGGGASAFAGVNFREIVGKNGIFSSSNIKDSFLFGGSGHNFCKPKMVLIEQTTNLGGGVVWSLDALKDISNFSKKHNLWVHIDGARIFNASVATNTKVSKYSSFADSICIDFAKGLGAPVGAMLCGNKEFIEKSKAFRIKLGGGMHKSGFMAKACMFALKNNINRLKIDHDNAKKLAFLLKKIEFLDIEPEKVETNILVFTIKHYSINAILLSKILRARGIFITAIGQNRIRLITSTNIEEKDLNYIYQQIVSVFT